MYVLYSIKFLLCNILSVSMLRLLFAQKHLKKGGALFCCFLHVFGSHSYAELYIYHSFSYAYLCTHQLSVFVCTVIIVVRSLAPVSLTWVAVCPQIERRTFNRGSSFNSKCCWFDAGQACFSVAAPQTGKRSS